ILGGVIAGIFICGDFDNKIIHDAIANGCSRSVVIVSKAVVFFCSIVFILIPYAIITGIALGTGSKFNMGSVAMGFLHVITSDGGKTFSAGDIGKLLLVMLTLIIVYAAQLSICILIAILSKKSVVVIAAYYAISIISGQLRALKNSSKGFDHIFACTPFGGNYGLLTLNSGLEDISKAILVSLIFIVVIIAVTNFAFRKSEIK
ncbi:MAG: ABC transporter permease, partial [Bacillota bacterium]|nr:ABC transporter permease [Bacillota bacterium]